MRSLLANLYDNLILAKPQAVLFLLLCVFGFFTYFANDFRLDASADSLLLQNDKALRQTRKVNEATCFNSPGAMVSILSGLNLTFQFSGLKERKLMFSWVAEPVFFI